MEESEDEESEDEVEESEDEVEESLPVKFVNNFTNAHRKYNIISILTTEW